MISCQEIKNEFEKNIGFLFECHETPAYTELITPFLYPDGDFITLYILRDVGKTIVTDLGETCANLYLHGLSSKLSKGRQLIFDETMQNQVIRFDDGELWTEVINGNTFTSLNMSIMRMSQAISRISDTVYMQKKSSKDDFTETVSSFLTKNKIPYERGFSIDGSSGDSYKIDFCVKAGAKLKLIKALSADNGSGANLMVSATLRTFYDIGKTGRELSNLTVYNAEQPVWKREWIDLLNNVSTVYTLKEPDRLVKELVS